MIEKLEGCQPQIIATEDRFHCPFCHERVSYLNCDDRGDILTGATGPHIEDYGIEDDAGPGNALGYRHFIVFNDSCIKKGDSNALVHSQPQ